MKLKFNKSIKRWEIVSDIFGAVFASFVSKKEAEYYLESNGYKSCYKVPNIPFDADC